MICHALNEDGKIDLLIGGAGREDFVHPFSDPAARSRHIKTASSSAAEYDGISSHLIYLGVGGS
jgi:hypothetical protein